jgi:hypothetical protein
VASIGGETGHVLLPQIAGVRLSWWQDEAVTSAPKVDSGSTRFIGGMSIEDPTVGFSRLNVTLGFAVMQISQQAVALGTWAFWIPKDRGHIEYPREEVSQVFGAYGLGFGVGFDTSDDRTHYFYTFKRAKVLRSLSALGYIIGEARHPSPQLGSAWGWKRRK